MQLKEGKKPLPEVGRNFKKKAKNTKNNKFQNLAKKISHFPPCFNFEYSHGFGALQHLLLSIFPAFNVKKMHFFLCKN